MSKIKKNLRRSTALLLTVIMCFSLVTTAFAIEDDDDLNVNEDLSVLDEAPPDEEESEDDFAPVEETFEDDGEVGESASAEKTEETYEAAVEPDDDEISEDTVGDSTQTDISSAGNVYTLPVRFESDIQTFASAGQTVDVTAGTVYYYNDYGLGASGRNLFTRVYTVDSSNKVFNSDSTIYAYCLNPMAYAPGSGTYTIKELSDSSKVAKVVFYGNTTYSRRASYWAQVYPETYTDLSSGYMWIITHLAAAYANGDSSWSSGANSTAQNEALALYNYAMSAPSLPDGGTATLSSGGNTVSAYDPDSGTGSRLTVSSSYNSKTGYYQSDEMTFKGSSKVTYFGFMLPEGIGATITDTNGYSYFCDDSTGDYVGISGTSVKPEDSDGHKGVFLFSGDTIYFTTTDSGKYMSKTSSVYLNGNITGYAINDGNSGTQDLGLVTIDGYSEKIRWYVDFNVAGELSLQKSSSDSTITSGNSCYSLAGAEYYVYTDSACSSRAKDTSGSNIVLTTASSGSTNTAELDAGTYYVKEHSASPGYLLDTEVYKVTVTAGESATVTSKEVPAYDTLGLSLTKISSDGMDNPASLAGAQFTVRFYAGSYSSVSGLPSSATRTWVIETKRSGSDYIAKLSDAYKVSGDSFYTDSDGNIILPLGTITIEETKAPTGYVLDGSYLNDSTGKAVTDSNGVVLLQITADSSASGAGLSGGNSYTVEESPIRGGVQVQKRDLETGKASPLGGATLEGAEFEIISENTYSVLVNDVTYQYGETVLTLITDEDGFAATESDTLPYGSYSIVEVTAPDGYLKDGAEEQTFQIRENGVIVDMSDEDGSIYNQVKRGDFNLRKISADSQRSMAGVTFTITSLTTGETHSFTTDANGEYCSASGWNLHSYDTNGGNYDSGLWFGVDAEADDSLGALPYDTYFIQEVASEANEGYNLWSGTLTIYRDNFTVDFEDIEDTQIELSTYAEFESTDSKWAPVSEEVSVVDEVIYSGLAKDTEYTWVSKLYNVTNEEFVCDADGNDLSFSKTFTARAGSGVTKLDFTFDATGLDGCTLVVYQYLYEGDTLLAAETAPDEEDQMLYFPAIVSDCVDNDTGTNISYAGHTITITDTVTYTNLRPNHTYTATGRLYVSSTGEFLKDANGNEITSTVIFKAEAADGSVDVTFEIDEEIAAQTAGDVLVCFEEIKYGDVVYALHEDPMDEAQMDYIPLIHTQAWSGETGDQVSHADGYVTLYDDIYYYGLKPGMTYTVYGVLLDAETREPEYDENGEKICGYTTFTPETSSGEEIVEYYFDVANLSGRRAVFYEVLYWIDDDGNTHLIAAEDVADAEQQTIYFPEIHTTAIDSETGINVSFADENVTLIDTVSYDHLKTGYEYTITGVLMNRAAGEALTDADGNEITSEYTFVADTNDGTIDMEFTLDASLLAGETIVAFETMYHNGVKVAAHTDITDEGQSVHIPEIGTTVTDADTGENVTYAGEDITLTDTVAFTNLVPGKEYKVVGTLTDQETGEPMTDDNGEIIIAETTFTPNTANGTVDVTFTFSGVTLGGRIAVVFEELYYKDVLVAVHADIDDEAQTDYIPLIHTQAWSGETGDQVSHADGYVTLYDDIYYYALKPGMTYTVYGVLLDAETREPEYDENGEKICGYTTFTPETSSGEEIVEYYFDVANLSGRRAVFYEVLYWIDDAGNTHLIAAEDVADAEQQTIYFPEIHTTAIDSETGINVSLADESVTLIDTVSYDHLKTGYEYTITGVLMNQSTGEALTDADGNEITSEVTFTPDSMDGSIDVVFTFDASLLAGETVVVFETMYHNGVKVAAHTDIEDEGQSIHIPDVHTTATDSETEDHLSYADAEITIIDRVEYTNLVPGKEYKVVGTLTDQETGEPMLDDNGEVITAETTFTPDMADGSVDLTFVFSGVTLAGKTVVAFEELCYGDAMVAVHSDIDDESQTVQIPKISTTALDDASKSQNMLADGTQTLTDTVSYENLIPGKTYVMTGVLMNKATGEALPDATGKMIMSSVTFTPDEPDGSVEMTFTLDATSLDGITAVVFETLTFNSVTIAAHSDIDDFDQSIFIPEIHTTAVDSETGSHTSNADEQVVIIDTVEFSNLIVGQEYTVTGTLYLKSAGKALTGTDGKAITASKTFTAKSANGSVDLIFTLDASALQGETIVVFEDVYTNGVRIGMHADLDDADQSIRFPSVGTTLTDADTGSHTVTAGEKITLVDTVELNNLTVGEEYTVTGVLHLKSGGESLKDANGNEITATITFTADKSDCTVELSFTFDGSALAGDSVVAFEYLYNNGVLVGEHADINDAGQSVEIVAPASGVSSPKTGDRSHVVWIVILATAAACALIVALVYDRKRKNNAGDISSVE